jgi:hypothetical protein
MAQEFNKERRDAMGFAVAGLIASGAASSAWAASPDNAGYSQAAHLKSVKALRVVTDANQESVIEEIVFTPNERPFFGVPGGLKEYIRFEANKFSFFSAPGNVDLPIHSVGDGRSFEFFYVIKGSSDLILRNGLRRTIATGDLIFFEDAGSKGRGGRTGPEGYLAINIGYTKRPTAS